MRPKQNEYDDLPPLVREIKQQTEDLIRIFDQALLQTCGIRWEEDIASPR